MDGSLVPQLEREGAIRRDKEGYTKKKERAERLGDTFQRCDVRN